MRNLKKVLTLVLTLAMLLSVMVVGAGAATFGDQDSITNDEAVDMCVALSIIGGYEDGTFRPAGNVTRAEMCKMICVALNGGKEPVMGSSPVTTFNDVASDHWAAPYIEYCVSQGIVGGVGGGNFNPNGNITGTQAAKMLLCILGYSAKIQGYVGNDFWETKINVDASAKHLYDGIANIDPSVALTRDNAAQMIWNALEAIMVTYKDQFTTENGQLVAHPVLQDKTSDNGDYITLLGDKYEGNVYEGVLLASGKYAITVAGKSGSSASDKMSIALQCVNGGTQLEVANAPVRTFDSSVDYTDLMGEYVKVVAGKNDKIYGVFSDKSENAILLNTTTNNVSVSGTQVEVDGTKYDLASTTAVIKDGNASSGTIPAIYATSPKAADSIKLVSYDGDKNIDLALVESVGVSQVNYVGSDSFTLTTPLAGSRSVGTSSSDYKSANQKIADVDVYSGVAKDDFVKVTKNLFNNTDVVEKMSVTSMTVTGTKGTVGTDAQFLMNDGNWYKYAANTLNLSGSTAEANLKVGDTADVIAIDNILYYVTKTSGVQGVKNVAYVINAADTTGANAAHQAYMIFPDGTKQTVETKADYSALKNQLVTFKSTSDGYELTALAGQTAANLGLKTISALNQDIQDAAGSEVADATLVSKLGGKEIADDAIVYLFPNTAETVSKVISGAELKRIQSQKFADSTAQFATTEENGFEKIAVAVIKVNNGANALDAGVAATAGYNTTTGNWTLGITSGKNYGYLVADAYGTTVDGKDYINYKMHTKDGPLEVKEELTYSSAIKAGSIITYDTASDGIVKNVTVLDTTGVGAALVGAISALNPDKDEVKFVPNDGTNTPTGTQEIDSKTVVLFVDSKNTAASNGSLTMAGNNDGVYVPNVRYLLDGSGKVLLIVADTNNIYDAATKTAGTTADEINNALNGNDAITSATTIPAGTVTVPDGRTLTLNGNVTTWTGNISVLGTLKIADNAACTTVAASITGVAGAKVILGTGATLANATNFYPAATDRGTTAPSGGAPTAGRTYVWTDWTFTDTDATPVTTTPMSGWVLVQ